MRDLSGQQTRQLIDTEQVYASYRQTRNDGLRRFAGSMAWKTVHGRRYLYRKLNNVWKSLGPESDASRQIYESFHDGRAGSKTRQETLDRELQVLAPINRAMGLGRVPLIAARILRRLDRDGVLGKGLWVAGTHAMFAYERMGGVHFGSDTVATQDIDLLYDARGTLKLVASETREAGLLGVLTRLDGSFAPTQPGSFRAANARGFMVDLITPTARHSAIRDFTGRIGDVTDDLIAVEIDGLAWLESSPTIERIAIDERGFPLTIVAPDPRAFVSHKLWIAQRDDRDPAKRRRDVSQAEAVVAMLTSRLPNLRFDDPALDAVPVSVRRLGSALADRVRQTPADSQPWDS